MAPTHHASETPCLPYPTTELPPLLDHHWKRLNQTRQTPYAEWPPVQQARLATHDKCFGATHIYQHQSPRWHCLADQDQSTALADAAPLMLLPSSHLWWFFPLHLFDLLRQKPSPRLSPFYSALWAMTNSLCSLTPGTCS